MIGHGVSSRSSHSDAAGRTTSAAKPWTQSRMSRWSSERSRLKGTGSSGTGSSIAGSALIEGEVGPPPVGFCSSAPRPAPQTSSAADKQQREAGVGVVEIVAEPLAQLVQAVPDGLRMDMERARDVRNAAVVLKPCGERREPPLGELGDERRIVLEQQRRQVVAGVDEPLRLDDAGLDEPVYVGR